MTYDSNLEAAEQEGLPEFYRFRAGNEINYLTSWPEDLSFIGRTFYARSLKRGSFTKNTRFGSVRLSIEAYLTDSFLIYVANHPIEPVELTIYRALKSDLTDYALLFKGELLNMEAEGNHVNATAEAGTRKLRTMVPRTVNQSYCNHDVFDSRCKAVAEDYKVTITLGSVSGRTVTASALAGYDDDWFSGGDLQFIADHRLIMDHTGDTLTLHTAFGSDLVAGTTVYVFPGCDGNPQTCIDKFDNLVNHLSMPYIPSRNPTVWGVDE